MHSILISTLVRATTLLKEQRTLLKLLTISKLRYNTDHIKHIAMAVECFKGKIDRYNGVTIDSRDEPCDINIFPQCLEASMEQWLKDKKRTIWFRVHLHHTDWVPILTKQGFKFHHAREEYVMLYQWLASDGQCNIPHYAHTNLGIGAFVYKESTSELLVVQEQYASGKSMWKLPGGFVEPGEHLEDAVKREIKEETGIDADFHCLVGFRHGHSYAFDCSDIYLVAFMTPKTFDIQRCTREIADCAWMKLTEYSEHPEVHMNNRLLANKLVEFLQHRMGIIVEYGIHPITNKPICVYSISNTRPEQSMEK